jgi:RND family efflux transporter MFP subunit
MTRGPKVFISIIAISLTGSALWTGWHSFSTQGQETQPATTGPAIAEDKPVATVQTALIRSGEISQSVTAYGSIAADPGAVTVYSVPADVRVVGLHVAAGQSVAKGSPLVDVEASADTNLQSLDARNALDAAKKNLADTQQRFNLKLATNTELLQSQQAAESAQAKLDNLKKRGIGEGTKTLRANADSFVNKVDVQQGQVVQASGPLLELLPKGRIEARLGVEPGDATQLRASQGVQLFLSTATTQPVAGKIRAVADRLNPDTRLVDVFVTPDAGAAMLLDNFVRGELTIRTERAMIVSRGAVLPSDQGFTLFTVKDGHAVKHTVTLGIESSQDVAIHSDELHEGDTVIVQGNLELDDGSAVSTEESK